VSLRRLTAPLLAATAALVVLLALRPLSTSRALAIWVILVAALVLLLLVRRSRERTGSVYGPFEAALRPRPPPSSETLELLRTERDLELGIAGAGHAHHRLLPILRAVAAARLASRHGVDLERRPDAARELLGDDVIDHYLNYARTEQELFDKTVTGYERERMFERG
jgi:hypothetical protein